MGRSTAALIEELYERHAGDAARLAFLLTGDREASEDLVNEAFLRILGRFGELRHPDAFRAYLLRSVVNLCNSHHRKRRSQRAYVALGGATSADGVAPQHSVEDADELWTALRRLPSRQRTAVVLRHCHDLSEREVATIMRTSPKAVRSLVGRAVQRLRSEVTP